MTDDDDERLARLTELARRLWPDQGATVRWDAFYDVAKVVNERGTILFEMQHPRSLDALEAALLVLAGEDPLGKWARKLAEDSVRAGDAAEAALAMRADESRPVGILDMLAVYAQPHDWVEQLAAKMEANGRQLVEKASPEMRDLAEAFACSLEAYADELRARARQGGER
jgi:glycine/D-amino acid oxidase-like deaminating enzyme